MFGNWALLPVLPVIPLKYCEMSLLFNIFVCKLLLMGDFAWLSLTGTDSFRFLFLKISSSMLISFLMRFAEAPRIPDLLRIRFELLSIS